MKFIPFPVIKTQKLLLRKIEAADSDEILFLRSDKIINKFIERPENRKTKNKLDALTFIKQITNAINNAETISWGITIENSPKIIGSICLWNFSNNNKVAEVGYDLNPKYHNKGIMSEALKNVINFGFTTLNLEKIEAFTHFKNENSKKLLIKNGFHFISNRKDKGNVNNIIFEIENTNV